MRILLAFSAVPLLSTAMLAQEQAPPNPPAQPTQAPAPAQASSGSSDAACRHVYRQRRYTGSALAPSIYVDDRQVARVGNGRRVRIRLAPASHTIRSDDKSSAISLDTKPGQDYYIRVDEETGFWKGHGRLTLLLPEQGAAEYKLQKPIEDDRKITKELILEDSEAACHAN